MIGGATATLVGMVAEGMPTTEILADFPQSSPMDVQEALRRAVVAVDERGLPIPPLGLARRFRCNIRRMAQKTVSLWIQQPVSVGNKDVTFRVHDGATHLGDVTISKGGIDWRPTRMRTAYKKRWAAFDELMRA